MKLYALYDSGGQGMKDNGLLGVYSTPEAAEKARGDAWYSIVIFESDRLYGDGVEYCKQPKNPKEAKPKNPLFQPCREVFEKWYKENIDDSGFYFAPKELGNLTGLIKKLKFKIGEKSRDTVSVEVFLSLFVKFIAGSYEVAKTERAFSYVKNHFSITQLNSQFNELFAKVRAKHAARKGAIDQYSQNMRGSDSGGQSPLDEAV